MNLNRNNRFIPFVKHRNKFFISSAVFVLIGIILLFTAGLNLGIDFQAGSKVQVLAEEPITEGEVADQFAEAGKGYEPDEVTLAGDNNEMAYASFIGALSQDEVAEIQNHFDAEYGQEPSVSTVTPQVGQELAQNALVSVLIASLGIILYVTIRFEFWYGLAAITALLHDAFFIIVVFSIVQFEVNVPFIAAVLTIVGYSINDTIVTFDRIRENMSYEEEITSFDDLARVVDLSLNQTLVRSINTVLTVVFAAAAIFILGGEAIRSFSFALLVGLVAGTYSSLFLASQLWLSWKWKSIQRGWNKPKEKDPEDMEPEV